MMTVDLVRLLLNLIWLIFGGLVMAFGYAVVALVMFVLIITIPFGIASARIALFWLWPFGRTLVRRSDAGTASLIGNVIWLILAGWWLAIGHLITGVLMCITIIGIPLGLANFKLIPVSLTPLGRDIVDLEQARRLGHDTQASMAAKPLTTERLKAHQAGCAASSTSASAQRTEEAASAAPLCAESGGSTDLVGWSLWRGVVEAERTGSRRAGAGSYGARRQVAVRCAAAPDCGIRGRMQQSGGA